MADAEMASPKDEPAAEPPAKENTPRPRVPYKSYRKKYRKMRVKFEDQMNEANVLFKREYQTWDVAKRLQEENDQLLDTVTDLLLDRSRSRSSRPTADEQARITERLHLSSMEHDLNWTPFDFPGEDILPTDLLDLDGETLELDDPERHLPPSYLTSTHEDKYLEDLDASLSTLPSTHNLPSHVETVNPEPPPRPRPSRLTEKDFRTKNPVSVGNWLQRHHPHIFEEQKEKDKEKDKESEKGAEPTTATGRSKGSKKDKDKGLSKQDQPFEGLDDEIGFDPNYEPPAMGSARGKRKRGDDDTYRPKGGHSRGAKRKRDDAEPKGKAGKKARTSVSGNADEAGGAGGAAAA